MRRPSNGEAGEAAAAAFFNGLGWRMHKTPPPFKVMGKFGKYLYGFFRSKGSPDFQGYRVRRVAMSPDSVRVELHYRAVEVKEVDDDRFPASGLKPDQRRRLEVMEADAPGHGLVGIYWRDRNALELFHYIPGRGSYVRGEGLNFPARPLVSATEPDGGRRDPCSDLRPGPRRKLKVIRG